MPELTPAFRLVGVLLPSGTLRLSASTNLRRRWKVERVKGWRAMEREAREGLGITRQ